MLPSEINVGMTFGQWRVVGTGFRNKYRQTMVECECSCKRVITLVEGKSLIDGRSTKCKKCLGHDKTTEEYIAELESLGIGVMLADGETYINSTTKINHICPKCGKAWKSTPDNVLNGRKSCKKCSGKELKTTKWYLDQLDKLEIGVVLKEGEEYRGTEEKIIHICSSCGREWYVTPHNVLSNKVRMCDECSANLSDSIYAIVMKQISRYYHGDSITWEDNSCVYKGQTLSTDIVNHKDKWVIEINGSHHYEVDYHTKLTANRRGTTPEEALDEQQNRDKIKKLFWESKGYKVHSVDIRNKTVLEVVQIHYPQMEEIPSWVDLSGWRTKFNWDMEKAQSLLDEGKTYRQVAELIGIDYSVISVNITRGNLVKPKCYKRKLARRTLWSVEVVQNLLNEGKTYQQIIDSLGITMSMLTHAIYDGRLNMPLNYYCSDFAKNKMKYSFEEAQSLLNEGYSRKEVAEKLGVSYSVINSAITRKKLYIK